MGTVASVQVKNKPDLQFRPPKEYLLNPSCTTLHDAKEITIDGIVT